VEGVKETILSREEVLFFLLQEGIENTPSSSRKRKFSGLSDEASGRIFKCDVKEHFRGKKKYKIRFTISQRRNQPMQIPGDAQSLFAKKKRNLPSRRGGKGALKRRQHNQLREGFLGEKQKGASLP